MVKGGIVGGNAKVKGRVKVAGQVDEIEKLKGIATDSALSSALRVKAIEALGDLGTHQALLGLLDIAANQETVLEERDLALRMSREIIKLGH